jgi:hypothetical protein
LLEEDDDSRGRRRIGDGFGRGGHIKRSGEKPAFDNIAKLGEKCAKIIEVAVAAE